MHLSTLLDMSAEAFGDRIAFGSRHGGLTYAELAGQARRTAVWAARRGVERVGLVDVNSDAVPVLLYGSGHGDPNKHDPKELPIIVVGSDQLKGGQHYRFPHAQLANLHVSLLNTLGMPVEKFGDVTGRLPGVV